MEKNKLKISVGWTIFWLIIFWPIAVGYVAFKLIDYYNAHL